MAYNAPMLDSWICHHLHLGFARLYLYLDVPTDAAVGVARRYPAERVCIRLRDAALDLSAALHRVDDPPSIGGVNAPEDAHQPAHGIDRDPEGVDVERHRARAAVGSAGGWTSECEWLCEYASSSDR